MVQLVILTTLWIISPPLSLAENHMQVTHEKVIHAAMFANFLYSGNLGEGGRAPVPLDMHDTSQTWDPA